MTGTWREQHCFFRSSRLLVIAGVGVVLAGCTAHTGNPGSTTTRQAQARVVDQQYGVSASPRVVDESRPIPRGGGVYRVGRPYTIAGRRYVPYAKREGHSEVGVASWYGRQFHGRLTANGEVYDMNALSAAHRTMPMPSYARVTNTRNGRSIIVRVNDRGPFSRNRVIDLSSRTAHLLDFRGQGLARVRVDYIGRAPLGGSNDRQLLATLRTDGTPAPRPEVGAGVMVASTANDFAPAQTRDQVLAGAGGQIQTQAPAVRPVANMRTPEASAPPPVAVVAAVSDAIQLAAAPLPPRRPALGDIAAAQAQPTIARGVVPTATTVTAPAQPATTTVVARQLVSTPAPIAYAPVRANPAAGAVQAFAPTASPQIPAAFSAPGALTLANGSLY